MLGKTVGPRWRLPLVAIVALCLLGGCSANREAAETPGAWDLPKLQMSLLKIPLNGPGNDTNYLDNQAPLERFAPQTAQVSNGPSW